MAFFSSSPVQPQQHKTWNSNLFDAQAPSSPFGSTSAAASLGVYKKPSNGELSPTFDQTFQSSMNISFNESDDAATYPEGQQLQASQSSPHAMDISPAPPATHKVIPGIPSFASSNKNSKTVSSSGFDTSFFAKLSANQPSVASPVSLSVSSASRSRTRSADLPLSNKDVNEQSSLTLNAIPNFPLKRPAGLLRTASAKVNPFEVSPRPLPHRMERARSDNQLVLGGMMKAKEKRVSSGLSKDTTTVAGPRPTIAPYPSQGSHGRRISGSSRIRSALPNDWQAIATGTLDVPPAATQPRLQHTLSAPLVKPLDWANFDHKSNSDTAVPTRRTLSTDFGSRLAREVMHNSSPNGMDIDPSSPQFQRQALACSPGLGDLFEENGFDASSPAGPSTFNSGAVTRKRGMEDADSSFTSNMSSSPVQSGAVGNTNTGSFSKASSRPRILHRATSATVLGGGSNRRRASGQTFGSSGSSSFFAAIAAAKQEDESAKDSSRHRKMSRGADGRPNLLKAGRRAQSMCDSEFYASPPLASADATGDYFGAHQEILQPIAADADHLAPPEDTLSPQRPKLMPLNSYQPSPEASFTSGFGQKEGQGKILPCFPVKEDGLMRITAATLSNLLEGNFDDQIDQYVVIDCRFDYEYKGGHVEGAINLGTSDAVERFLLQPSEDSLYASREEMPYPTKSGEVDPMGNTKKTILIFHCEFSAKRAPTLATHLRSKDRALNHAYYPATYFPEVYILQGGYAEYFKQYPEACEPKFGYIQMDDPRHLAARNMDMGELRRKRFGVRAKSYAYGEGQGQLFADKPMPSKYLSGVAAKPASSLGNSLQPPAPAFNATHFSGVINAAQLSVHEEEHEHDDEQESSAEGETSFTGTKHSLLVNDSSSPCAPMAGAAMLMTGDSPCPTNKPKSQQLIFPRPGLFSTNKAKSALPLKPSRTLQRASTSSGFSFS